MKVFCVLLGCFCFVIVLIKCYFIALLVVIWLIKHLILNWIKKKKKNTESQFLLLKFFKAWFHYRVRKTNPEI